MREIFPDAYSYLHKQREKRTDRRHIKLPSDRKEFVAIYTTEYADTFILECLTKDEIYTTAKEVSLISEDIFERDINYLIRDDNAHIDTVVKPSKVRKLNRAIGTSLKSLYEYRCQICGEDFGKRYDAIIVESHHIDPFVKSLNNNPENQIILCPNHHRTIHIAKPSFNRRMLLFEYGNGLKEVVGLNYHL